MSTRVTATVVCCILMQILCVVSQKSFSFWGTIKLKFFVPQAGRPPTGVPPLDPAGGLPSPRSPVFFYVPPNNPVRSTPLVSSAACKAKPITATLSTESVDLVEVLDGCDRFEGDAGLMAYRRLDEQRQHGVSHVDLGFVTRQRHH